ncbi:XRE family transcriptional regulator [uncultured Gemmiger sp.]|uniref:XRE family transcriptional regulator n=1 Tax=uncultured Gemmiger sp. TaxID=1623490 RepID=UPI0025CBE0E4|nr:XRE family transcriptional regulator [uncultured Gemmiger sp.]
MDFVLKQFDDVLLNFMTKRTIDGIDVSITSINKDKVERLPLGMSPTSESLTRWLRHRTIPANRAYAQNFLSKNGLSENDFIGILQICKGLSLTDCYWVTYPNDQKTFAEVNLFDNRFSQVLSQIAFTGYGSSPASKFRSSPEFTTNGMLPKAWRRKEGKVLLYKGGTSGLANTGKEPYSEFYAAQVAEAMGIPHVTYGLSKWKGQLCSTCELFTSKDISFVPASTLIRTSRISQIIDWFDDHGWKNDLADMLVLDAIIRNTDRHLGNFGFLVDNHTNQLLRPAPIFDNGLSLYCYVMDNDLNNLAEQEKTLAPALYANFDEVALHVIGQKQKQELRHLLTFKFKKHSRYNLSDERIKMLESAIQGKVRCLLESA